MKSIDTRLIKGAIALAGLAFATYLFIVGRWGWGIVMILICAILVLMVMRSIRMILAFFQIRKQDMPKAKKWLEKINPDHLWKNQKGYPNPQWGPFREIWHITREAGESALILLMVDEPKLSSEEQASLQKLIGNFDYTHNASCGLVYHLAAYWKARRHKLL